MAFTAVMGYCSLDGDDVNSHCFEILDPQCGYVRIRLDKTGSSVDTFTST